MCCALMASDPLATIVAAYMVRRRPGSRSTGKVSRPRDAALIGRYANAIDVDNVGPSWVLVCVDPPHKPFTNTLLSAVPNLRLEHRAEPQPVSVSS